MASTSNAANKRPAKDSSSDLSEDDAPLTKRAKPSNGNGKEDDDSSDDDAPLSKTNPQPTSNGNGNGVKKEEDDKMDLDSEDSDAPLTKKDKPAPRASTSSRKRSAPVKSEDSDEDSDDEPLSQKPTAAKKNGKASSGKSSKNSTPAKKKGKKSATPASEDEDEEDDDDDDEDDEDDEDGDDEEDEKSTKKGKKSSGGTKAKGGSSKKLETGRGGRKWNTLYHTGPRFPEEYTPLPSDIMLKYDGKSVPLPPESEEAAMFYAQKLETQHARGEVFNKNFFDDFKKVLKKHPAKDGTKIEKFSKCDFRPMYDYWRSLKDGEAERRKGLAPSARKDELEQKKKLEAEMKTCIVDGEEQKVGNVMAEPPSLFLGRGAHPKTGHIKARIRPEDITINHTLGDPDHPPPEPPAGHKWKEVIQNNNVTWLAYWQENINGQYKYMYLDATSNFKTNSDREKYEKARKLDKCIKKLRAKVDENLSSKNRPERQIATVVWLIDNYSLRAGNEKGDDEAATYGACSLLVEHATLIEPSDMENDPKYVVKLSFLGKDSMKFEERLEMPQRVFNNFKMFTRSSGKDDKTGEPVLKKGSDPIFHCIDTGDVNNFIQDPANGGMKGLSAKVFRTYNASTTFQGLLNRTEEWLSERKNPDERILNFNNLKLAYNEANRQVAILCNHQKTVNPVAHEKTLQRTEDKMFAIRYERHKELQKLLTHHTAENLKKNYPAKEHDFAKKWSTILEPVKLKVEDIKAHEEAFIEAKKQRIRNAFDKAEKEKAYQAEKKEKETEELSKKGKKIKQQVEEEENGTSTKKGPKTQREVDELLKELDDQLKVLEKERKTNKSTSDTVNVPSTCKKILGKGEALKKQKSELANKENTKEVSLGTSKLNYIDPRVTLAWLKKFDNKLLAQREAEDAKGSSKKKGGKKAVKKEEDEEEEEDVKPAKGGKKGKGKAKKEDSDDEEDEKPLSKGKGKGKATLKADPDEVEARTKVKDQQRGNKNTTGTSEKMELGLKIMPIGNFFPATMQKKFKWAATDDDGKDLSPDWVFVEDAEAKMRTMSSAIVDSGVAKEEKKKKEGAFRPQHKPENEPDYDA